jgi:1,2-diacylglycerol 3-beta-galactosyltransferase
MSYRLSNTRRRARVLSQGVYLTNRQRLNRMVRDNPADVVVCVHSVVTRPSMQALMTLEKRPPFISVVTDLVSTHMFWYEPLVERCLVPTQPAFDRGLDCGLTPDQLRVTGLPVHPHFVESLPEKAEARSSLGWDPNLPVILMVAGGDGMGPLYETARAINNRRLKCQLAIVAGRNQALKSRLDASNWNQPTCIYPFVKDMPRFMAAADILVTKAGPATITEACIAGLPMILSDAIPGQETGNVDYVVDNDAGVFAPNPRAVGDAVTGWLAEGKAALAERAERALRLARPEAVWDIADEVWEYAHLPHVPTGKRSLWDEIYDRTRQLASIQPVNNRK